MQEIKLLFVVLTYSKDVYTFLEPPLATEGAKQFISTLQQRDSFGKVTFSVLDNYIIVAFITIVIAEEIAHWWPWYITEGLDTCQVDMLAVRWLIKV